MSSPIDNEREFLRRLAAQAAEASRPEPALLSDSLLLALVEHLDANMTNCDHTQRQTCEWLDAQTVDHPIDEILLWLARHGGGCDCEVAANFYDRVEYLRPQPQRPEPRKKRKRDPRSLVNPAGWQLGSLPKPWRIANLYLPDDPIQIQLGKRGGCTLTIFDQPLPIDSVTDDLRWKQLWHNQLEHLPESVVSVEFSVLQLPKGLMSVTTSSPGWTPVYAWIFSDPHAWYVRVATESNRRNGDFPQISQLISDLQTA